VVGESGKENNFKVKKGMLGELVVDVGVEKGAITS
jgi:hypothetical protein